MTILVLLDGGTTSPAKRRQHGVLSARSVDTRASGIISLFFFFYFFFSFLPTIDGRAGAREPTEKSDRRLTAVINYLPGDTRASRAKRNASIISRDPLGFPLRPCILVIE